MKTTGDLRDAAPCEGCLDNGVCVPRSCADLPLITPYVGALVDQLVPDHERGVDDPYERPFAPELVIETARARRTKTRSVFSIFSRRESSCGEMKRLLFPAIAAAMLVWASAGSAAAAGRTVLFVDNSRAGGAGTYERPFGTLAEAQRSSHSGDVIFVAETSTPYEGSIALTKGQMLIGSAFGLDAVRAELHIDVEAPPVPAAQGSGPVIHGVISLAGDNVVAGCTVVADNKTGAGVSVQSPQGPIALRAMNFRTSNDAYGLYVENSVYPLTWTAGRLDAADHGSGILINGGSGDVTIDGVPIAGEFANAIAVRGRTGGAIVLRNGSTVRISDASREGVTLTSSRGSVTFDSPLQVKTSGGRGVVINHVDRVAVSGGASWIEATNGTAIDVRDASVNIVLERVSAEGIAPGRLMDAIITDKVRGRFEITGQSDRAGSGGTIRNALSYAVRLTQSRDIRIANMAITGGGSTAPADECPQDIAKQTNVRCRAALYLRHVASSAFENIAIADTTGVGVNTNNLIDVTFAGIHVTRAGDQPSEPALLIDEARGDLSFARCSFADGGGGGVVIEQRFNSARVTFDRCEIAAPQRPTAAASLFRARTTGSGKLDLVLLSMQIHDNAGSGIAIEANEKSTAALTVRDSRFDRLGSTAIDVAAADAANVTIILSSNRVVAPAVREPLISVRLAGAAAACFDASANELAGGGSPSIRLSAPSPQAKVIVAGAAGESAVQAIGQRNGATNVEIGASVISITSVCR